MQEQFVTYEIAKKVNKSGFTGNCLGAYEYTKECVLFYTGGAYPITATKAPLWQQVIDWLREKYQYHFELIPDEETKEWYCISYYMVKMDDTHKEGPFKTYQEARMAGVLTGLQD